MTWLHIEPRDGLILRDGRPNQGRSESRTLSFPYPQTVAGAVRTALGSVGGGAFELAAKDEVLKAAIRGPLLVDADAGRTYVRAPADAIFVGADVGTAEARALRPLPDADGDSTDLVGGAARLALVGLPRNETVVGKAPRGLPVFWSDQALDRWLTLPLTERAGDAAKLLDGGLGALPQDERIHVALRANTATAEDGMLFATSALSFLAAGDRVGTKGFARTLRLAVDANVEEVAARYRGLPVGVRPLGGERRLVSWTRDETAPSIERLPEQIVAHARSGERTTIRVVLLTPAVFSAGALPRWLLEVGHGVTPRLLAAAVGRPETVSGWDFALGKPKATRRLASAGSVFWIELEGAADARAEWVRRVWLSNVSDDEQDRRDGFGLAAVGVGP